MNKFQTTLLSFGVMLLFWAMLFHSWAFALAFLVLLGLHEMGHWTVARALGMNVSMPIFTPLGALINLRQMPRNAVEEALMAYGGPFLGTVASIIALLLGHAVGSPTLLLAAKVSFWLNLFNLVPLSPLDGGRISMAIDRRLWVLGAVAMVGFVFTMRLDLLSVIVLAVIANFAYKDVQARAWQAQSNPEYFRLSMAGRAGFTLAYAGLIAFLLFMLGAL